MAGSSTNGGAMLTEINVTPLVDVVLVLLILMMVTATSLASKTIPVELPKAKSGSSDTSERPLVVAVDDGSMFLDKERADDNAVRVRAREALAAANAGSRPVNAVLAADGRARHEAVVHALEILRSERVAKIAIVVRAEAER